MSVDIQIQLANFKNVFVLWICVFIETVINRHIFHCTFIQCTNCSCLPLTVQCFSSFWVTSQCFVANFVRNGWSTKNRFFLHMLIHVFVCLSNVHVYPANYWYHQNFWWTDVQHGQIWTKTNRDIPFRLSISYIMSTLSNIIFIQDKHDRPRHWADLDQSVDALANRSSRFLSVVIEERQKWVLWEIYSKYRR